MKRLWLLWKSFSPDLRKKIVNQARKQFAAPFLRYFSLLETPHPPQKLSPSDKVLLGRLERWLLWKLYEIERSPWRTKLSLEIELYGLYLYASRGIPSAFKQMINKVESKVEKLPPNALLQRINFYIEAYRIWGIHLNDIKMSRVYQRKLLQSLRNLYFIIRVQHPLLRISQYLEKYGWPFVETKPAHQLLRLSEKLPKKAPAANNTQLIFHHLHGLYALLAGDIERGLTHFRMALSLHSDPMSDHRVLCNTLIGYAAAESVPGDYLPLLRRLRDNLRERQAIPPLMEWVHAGIAFLSLMRRVAPPSLLRSFLEAFQPLRLPPPFFLHPLLLSHLAWTAYLVGDHSKTLFFLSLIKDSLPENYRSANTLIYFLLAYEIKDPRLLRSAFWRSYRYFRQMESEVPLAKVFLKAIRRLSRMPSTYFFPKKVLGQLPLPFHSPFFAWIGLYEWLHAQQSGKKPIELLQARKMEQDAVLLAHEFWSLLQSYSTHGFSS